MTPTSFNLMDDRRADELLPVADALVSTERQSTGLGWAFGGQPNQKLTVQQQAVIIVENTLKDKANKRRMMCLFILVNLFLAAILVTVIVRHFK